MGYQEYLIKFKNEKDLEKAALYLDKYKKEFNIFFSPCTVVTFKDRINTDYNISFNPGEKSICLQGERLAGIREFIFKHDHDLGDKAQVIPLEAINKQTLDKMFLTHELAKETKFNNYVRTLDNELER